MTHRDSLRLFQPDDDGNGRMGPSKPASQDRSSRDQQWDAAIQRDLDRASGVNEAKTVTITLGQMVPLLIDAVEKNRLWLTDFADESVAIDSDLYEVLLAYQRMRRRDAA